MSAITLRPMCDGDLEAVAAVWLASWLSIDAGLEQTDTVASLRGRLEDEGRRDWRITVAERDQRIVAFMAINPAAGILNQLFIHPAEKNGGLGTRLLNQAMAEMPDGFWLRTTERNRAARAFYEHRGLRLGRLETHPISGLPMAIYVWEPRRV